MLKLYFSCFILLFGGLCVADNVPVLIWGPFNHYIPAIALKTYNGEEFIDVLSQHITPETFALVISEDQLSNEDLSQCKSSQGQTCFQGIQKIRSKLYLSSVEDPISVLDDISGQDKTEVTLLSNGALSEPLNAEGGKYVYINFDDNSDETKSTKLTRHDQLITKLSEELAAKNINLLVIYTGKRSEYQKRYVRQAPSTSAPSTAASSTTVASINVTSTTKASVPTSTQPRQESTPTFFGRSRLLVYFNSLLQVQQPNNAATEAPIKVPINVTDVTVTEHGANILTISMVAGTNTLTFNITNEGGYWWLSEFSWDNTPLRIDTSISSVDGFSFHCTPVIELHSRNPPVLIQWEGLQIQPYFGVIGDSHNFTSFGDSWDCVGFVSPGIVGGLFVVIILLFILSIGISFMMDINTMDRFDDPKGKTITINTAE